VCNIADRVYFDVVDHLELWDKAIEANEEEGTKNTEYGENLYYLIEEAVKNAIDYQDLDAGFIASEKDKEYTCPKFEPIAE